VIPKRIFLDKFFWGNSFLRTCGTLHRTWTFFENDANRNTFKFYYDPRVSFGYVNFLSIKRVYLNWTFNTKHLFRRIALARVLYRPGDIYFLDTPLSAVDGQVGQEILRNAIGRNGILQKKTRVFTTASLYHLQEVDQIHVISSGTIVKTGTYSEILEWEVSHKFLYLYPCLFILLCLFSLKSTPKLLILEEIWMRAYNLLSGMGLKSWNPRNPHHSCHPWKSSLLNHELLKR